MILNFSERYFYYLHEHLLDRPLDYHWEFYYNHALRDWNVTRLIMEGMNAHITVDLARALADTDVYPEFEEDYLLIGNNIWRGSHGRIWV